MTTLRLTPKQRLERAAALRKARYARAYIVRKQKTKAAAICFDCQAPCEGFFRCEPCRIRIQGYKKT